METNYLHLFVVDFMIVTGIILHRMTRNDHHKNKNDVSHTPLTRYSGKNHLNEMRKFTAYVSNKYSTIPVLWNDSEKRKYRVAAVECK
jgi:hypothetical protein